MTASIGYTVSKINIKKNAVLISSILLIGTETFVYKKLH